MAAATILKVTKILLSQQQQQQQQQQRPFNGL